MNKIVDDFEKYELVMRQMRKILIRMDEVLLECTNITPEEYSEWNKVLGLIGLLFFDFAEIK